MAKVPKDTSNQEIKKLLEGLYKVVQVTNSTSKEQIKINRELLKVMSLLQAGFAQNQEDARQLIDEVSSGLELTDEYAKKWAKARGAAKSDLDDIIDKFRQLEKLDIEAIDNAKDYIDLLQERYDLLHDETDLSSRLLKSHLEIAQAIRDSKKAAQQLGGSVIDIDNTVEKLVRRKIDLGSMFDDMFSSVDVAETLIGKIQDDIQSLVNNTSGSVIDFDLNFNPLTADLDKEIKDVLESVQLEKNARLDGLTEYFNRNKKLQTNLSRQMASQMSKMNLKIDIDTGDISTATGNLQKGTLEYQKVIDKLDKTINKNNISDQVQKQFSEIVNLIGLGVDRTEEQTQQMNKLLSSLDLGSKLLLEQYEIHNQNLETYNSEIQKQKILYGLLGENLHLLSTAESIVQKIGSGFDYISAILPPGIGDFLGLSKVSLSLLEDHKKGVQSFVDSLSNGANKSEAIQSYLKSFGPSIKLALNPMTLLVAGALLLFETLTDIVDRYKKMTSEMKVSLLQASKLLQVQLDIITSQKNQFATLQDIQDVQTEFISSTGKVFDLSTKSAKELTINLVEIGKAFGYGSTEATKLHMMFRDIGADDTLAKNLQQNLGLMSEMAGLSPQIVSQDLIDASEIVSTYFAGMPDKAAKAVIQVRRMGMSLKQAGSIAQQMLNLEGFMTDMYELQAMSRGGIDFSKAFEKGLMGDIEGMTKDIMDNIGTTAEYNKMDYLTRVKIAKTLNMSVDDLAKSVRLREQMNGLSQKEQDYLNANLDKMGDISNFSQDEIRNRLQQLQSTDRLSVAWDKIKYTLLKALIPLAETFADVIDAISPLVDVLVGALKFVGILIKPLVPLVKGMLLPFKMIGDLVSGIVNTLESWFDPVTNLESPLKSVHGVLDLIGKAAYYIGAAFSTWFIGKKVLGGLGLIKSETKGLGTLIPGIGEIFSSVFSGSAKSVTEANKNMKKSNSSALSSVVDLVEESGEKIQKSAKNTSGKTSFISSDATKSAFKVVGAIAATSFAKMATDGIQSFFKVKKEGVEQMNEMSMQSMDIFSSLFAGGGALLGGYLQEGIEKYFSKKLEKTIEDKLSKGFSKGMKSIKKLDSPISGMFDKISNKSKGLFEKIVPKTGIFKKVIDQGKFAFSKVTNLGKKLLPSVFNPMTKSIDAFAGKVEDTETSVTEQVTQVKKIIPKIDETVAEKVKPKKKEISETITKTKEIKQPKVQKTKSPLVSIFDSFSQIIERGSKMIRTVLNNLTKTVTSMMRDLSTAIGSVIKNIAKGLGDGLVIIGTSLGKVIKVIIESFSPLGSIIEKTLVGISKGLSSFGNVIKSLLKGLADGLSSFKVSSLKGAAALVIVSSALWITSKALQNFASVKWEDIGKGLITLGGLSAVSMLLGKSSGQMIVGALAIAALGAALIPAAYALEKFNQVDWSSLGKAGLALIGLGVAGTILGGVAPAMLLGALAIAAVGASIIPLAIAMKMFNDIEWDSLGKAGAAIVGFGIAAAAFGVASPLIVAGSLALGVASASLLLFSGSIMILSKGISEIDVKPIQQLSQSLMDLTSVSISQLLGISGALSAISAALLAFNTVSLVGSIGKIFGNDIIKDLERLGKLADPLYIVNQVITDLGNSLTELSAVLSNIDLSNIEKIKDLGKLDIDTKVQQQLEPLISNQPKVQRNNPRVDSIKISPIQPQVATVLPPKKEAVAQDKKIGNGSTKKDYPEQKIVQVYPASNKESATQQEFDTYQDIYNRPGQENKTIEALLRQLVMLTEYIAKKDPQLVLDGQRVSKITKKFNNNIG